ncbi:MAG: D-2-hydroxyacid dehydrogenase [Burkholderiaceae bacterium]
MPKPNVLLWVDSGAIYAEAVKSAGLDQRVSLSIVSRQESPSPEQLARAEVLMAYSVPPGVLASMPDLRWIQAMTAGVEAWMARPDLPDTLTLTCARGTHRESMPENIIGALLFVAKPYSQAVANQKRRQWVQKPAEPLTGKTLGILGLGTIGVEVARIAAALGLRVIGTRRRPRPMENVADVLPPERSSELLAESDFVLALLPATPKTDCFINAERLKMMKPGAWLLNFGRGQLVNDPDLIAAVQAGQIAGAVLDVFRQEPLPADDPFWSTEGIIVLPHIGGPHPDRDRIVARLFVANLERFLNGKPLEEVVDREAGY